MTSNLINSLNSGGHNGDVVVLQGYHKKLKTMKKKYFVLSGDDGIDSARLEYFDTEKKFKSKMNPKRVIKLKNCYNINRRLDTKQKYVIGLSSKEGCFCIVLETEDEMHKWLTALLVLQRGEDTETETLKPNFEHIWQVQIQKRGIAELKGIVGTYHVCLTQKSLTLLRIGQDRTTTGEYRVQSIELILTTIRRCGSTQCYFYLEVGRQSVIGAGELWMETEDPMIAGNMHEMIINAMKTKTREDTIGPMRQRSSSANEASKPVSMVQRRQTHSGQKTINSSPLSESPNGTASTISSTNTVINATDLTSYEHQHQQQSQQLQQQCAAEDTKLYQTHSLNCSSSQSQSQHHNDKIIQDSAMSSVCHQRALSLPIGGDTYITNNDTIHSTGPNLNLNMSTRPYNSINHINNNNSSNNSTNSITTNPNTNNTQTIINNNNNNNNNNNCFIKCPHYNNATNNIVSSLKPFHQRTRSLPLTEETAISSYNQISAQSTTTLKTYHNNAFNNNNNLNNNNNSIIVNNINNNNNNANATNGGNNIQCPCKSQHNILCIHHSCKGFTNNCSFVLTPPNNNHLVGSTLGRERCDSLPSSRNRTISECSNHSINNATMLPPRVIPSMINRPHSVYNNRHSHSPPMNALSLSTGCSESEGSSLSIDETDSYGNTLTHDESGNLVLYFNSRTSSGGVIIEENCDDWLQPEKCHMLIPDKLNNHGGMSLSILSNNQTSMRKGSSPASNCHIGSIDSHSQHMDMYSPYSPCGSSPCDQSGNGYVPISPGLEYPPKIGFNGSSGGHSRGSSLAEENTDGYVPMGPPHPHDYVDMSQSNKPHHSSNMSLAASSCSITSGTPSTDLRFADYTLEKVQSRFTPDDEDIHLNEQRPARAYSVGSRIEHKRKLVPTNTADQNSSRVRAFSVGSRAKVARSDLYRGVFNSNQMSGCNNNNNNSINQDICENVADVAIGKKSSSVPILVNKSQSSVDRMSDLMEIDYSKNSDRSDSQSDSLSSPTARVSSFPVSVPLASRTRCDTYGGSPLSNSKVTNSGYMEMKPGSYDKVISSSPLSKSINNGYLEMKPGGGSTNSSLGNGIYTKSTSSFSGSPLKATASPKPFTKSFTITGCESSSSDYITMSPSTSMSPALANNSIDKNLMSNMSSSCDKPMEVDNFTTFPGTPEGYMEMSFGKSSSSTSSSTNQKPENITKIMDDIVWSANRSPSLPINIKTTKDGKTVPGLSFSETLMRTLSQSSDTKEQDLPTPVNNQTTQFMFSPSSPIKPIVSNDFTQRKCLVDATSGSITITPKVEDENAQPSSITPEKYKILNTDHVNSVAKKNMEKVEALVNDYADLSLGSSKNVQSVKMPQKNIVKPIVVTADSNDYVNYEPANANRQTKTLIGTSRLPLSTTSAPVKPMENKINNDSDGDYAVMNPSLAKKHKSVIVSSSGSVSPSISQPTYTTGGGGRKVQTQDRKPSANLLGFKPIQPINDEALLSSNSLSSSSLASSSNRKSASPRTTLSSSSRNDKKHRKNDSDYGYEMIHMASDSSIQAKRNEISMHTRRNLTRPNSVNSEKISPMKACVGGNNRPNSANSDCIQSISASSSTSTLCGSSSSSSTLCGGSKSQSPLSISRPPSIIDYLYNSATNSGAIANDSSSDTNLLSVRPSSVTSEKELHYASLDLPPSTTALDGLGINTKANSSSPAGAGGGGGGDSSTSPSPNSNINMQQSTFTYAKIDFNRIETHKAALKAGQGNQ